MLMVAGPSLEEGHFFRSVCLLTGTCYNPQVWDATCLEFEQVGDEASEQLTLPCHVKIATRPCLANASFTAIGTQTSDEWISNLVEKLGAMQLHKVVYEVICPDGTLLWSRITALEDMGELWAPGMATRLAFRKPGGGGGAGSEHKKRQGIFKGMSGKDPFSEGAAKDLAARSRRGRGKGRGGAAGSRARERSAPLPPGGPSDALAIEDVHMEDAADLAAADGPPPGPPGAPHRCTWTWQTSWTTLHRSSPSRSWRQPLPSLAPRAPQMTPTSSSMLATAPLGLKPKTPKQLWLCFMVWTQSRETSA